MSGAGGSLGEEVWAVDEDWTGFERLQILGYQMILAND